eukprot:PhM_4_TR8430/c1_g4_i8/m.4059
MARNCPNPPWGGNRFSPPSGALGGARGTKDGNNSAGTDNKKKISGGVTTEISTPGKLQNMLSLLVVYSDNVKFSVVRRAVDKALSQYPEEDIPNICDSVCRDLSHTPIASIDNVDVEALSKRHGCRGTVTRIVFARLIRMLWDDIIFPNAL